MRSPLKMWCSALWIVMLYSALLLAVLPVIVWSELEDNPPGKVKSKSECNVLETFAFAARRNEGIYWSLESTSDNFWRKKIKSKSVGPNHLPGQDLTHSRLYLTHTWPPTTALHILESSPSEFRMYTFKMTAETFAEKLLRPRHCLYIYFL